MTTTHSSPPEQRHRCSRSAAAIALTTLPGAIVAAGPVLGAIYASLAGLHPTGDPVADIIWSALFGAVLTFVVSRANPALWILCSSLTVLAATNTALVAGYSLAIVGLWGASRSGWRRSVAPSEIPAWFAMLAGILTGPLLYGLGDLGYPGASAAVSAVAFALFSITAARMSGARTKQFLLKIGLVAAFGVTLFGFVSLSFVSSLRASVNDTEIASRTTVSAIRDGDLDGAIEALAQVEASLSRADDHFSRRTARVLNVLPAAGHNISALEDIVDASHNLARSTTRIGSPSVRLGTVFVDGKIEPQQLEALRSDLGGVSSNLRDLEGVVSQERPMWVAPQITRAVDDLHSQLTPAFERSGEFDAIFAALPDLLGLDSPRRYLVLFGNPAEARELGGLTGATAVLELDGGSFELETTGRRTGPQQVASVAALTEPPPVRFLEHRPWLFEQNYSAMADFPTLSRALNDLFPAMGGREIDGVIYLDPFALAAIIPASGSIDIPSLGRRVSAHELPNLLLVEQYEHFLPGLQRDQFFSELFEGVAGLIQTQGLDLDRDSGLNLLRKVEEGRLLFAPIDRTELAAVESLNLTGRITPRSPNDYLAVSHLNSGGNKLDAYIERTATYDVRIDPSTDALEAELSITLDNTATTQLPEYVLGRHNENPGTARTTLVVHSPHADARWVGSDEPELSRSFREFDRWRHEAVVYVPAGEQVSISLLLQGSFEPQAYALDIDHQPLVNADEVTIRWTIGDAPEQERSLILRQDSTVR